MPLIRVDHAGMQGLVHSLAAVAETFDVLPQPLRNRADDAAAAAGEFAAAARARCRALLTSARRNPLAAQGSGINQVFRGRQFGYLRTSVDARVPSDMERVPLNYSFHWEPSGG